MASELVERAGIAAEDFLAFRLAQRGLEGEPRIIKVPMRVIRREQQPVDADPFDQRSQMFCFVGLIDRLRREPEVLAHIFRRTPLEMRNFATKTIKMLAHPPHRRGDPAEPAFDEHDFEPREMLEHALDHEARELGRHRMRIRLVLLGVIRRPAAAGWRMTAITADMNAERQAEFLRAGVDRPITVTAERLGGARTNTGWHREPDLGASLDLGDRGFSVVLADQDRGLQPRFAVGPKSQLPLIDGALDRGAEIEILLGEDEEIEHLQDAELDVERIEMLLAHEGQI